MTTYYGDLDPTAPLDFKFTTVRDTGTPFDLCGPTLVVFKDNSTTCETSGVTLTATFGGRTGLNHVRIDTAACGTFYSAGSNFNVVLSAGTVNSVSVAGYTVGAFSIHARSPLRPTVAGRTADVTASGAVAPDWGNVENPGATVALSGTTLATVTALSAAGMDAILDRPLTEPTGVFAWGTATLRGIIQWLGARASNHQTQTATTTTVRNRANDCNIATSTSSDDGVTTTRGSFS